MAEQPQQEEQKEKDNKQRSKQIPFSWRVTSDEKTITIKVKAKKWFYDGSRWEKEWYVFNQYHSLGDSHYSGVCRDVIFVSA